VNLEVKKSPLSRPGAIPIDRLPEFDVGGLLQVALGQIDSADQNVRSGAVVQGARQEIVAMLAVQPIKGAQPNNGQEWPSEAESILRRAATNLMTAKDPHIESGRLALMSAADMLRTSVGGSVKQPEIPKVGSTDAPGG
jgi:hypothetical protein